MSQKAAEKQERNARGIPKAPFIVRRRVRIHGADPNPEAALKDFQAALAKYRYMDNNLTQRRRGLEEKIPDIKKTLSMVEFLQERREGKDASAEDDLEDDDLGDDDTLGKPLTTTFELNDTLYTEAELEDTDTVYLWLGLTTTFKLEAAQKNLSTVIEDLEFLREQITIMEVNTARVYNWDVKRRRELREKEAKEGEAKAG